MYASASSERDLRIEKRFLLAARLLVGVAPSGVSCTDSVLRILNRVCECVRLCVTFSTGCGVVGIVVVGEICSKCDCCCCCCCSFCFSANC